MKKALMLFLAASTFGLLASAADMTPDTTVHAYFRSCDSPYLGNDESCVSDNGTCPPGYTEGTANYCSNALQPQLHYCGMTCDSLYRGGH